MLKVGMDIDGCLRDARNKVEEMIAVDFGEDSEELKRFQKTENSWNALEIAIGDEKKAKEWMYESRPFHIFGLARKMYSDVITDLIRLHKTGLETGLYEVTISSVQKEKSIQATLHWLARWGCTLNKYEFVSSFDEKVLADYDVVIDDHVGVLKSAKERGALPIRILHPYNDIEELEDVPTIDYILDEKGKPLSEQNRLSYAHTIIKEHIERSVDESRGEVSEVNN